MKFALADIQLRSPSFEANGRIPKHHTGEGGDTSPALEWTGGPEGTRSYAVICHDPDAPVVSDDGYGFVHWLIYNIPSSVNALPEGVSGYAMGKNSRGDSRYMGPMPPPGHGTHHYFFLVVALNEELSLVPGLTLSQFGRLTESKTIGINRLVGTYDRS